jgi:hypothetical protein
MAESVVVRSAAMASRRFFNGSVNDPIRDANWSRDIDSIGGQTTVCGSWLAALLGSELARAERLSVIQLVVRLAGLSSVSSFWASLNSV